MYRETYAFKYLVKSAFKISCNTYYRSMYFFNQVRFVIQVIFFKSHMINNLKYFVYV